MKWPLLYNLGRAHRLGERMTKVEAGRRLLQINCTSSASLLILPTNEFLLSVSSIIQGCVLLGCFNLILSFLFQSEMCNLFLCTCNCWHLCRKIIMQILIARCWLRSFFRTMAEAGIPTTIFSSAEKQTARNYNLEIRHKFKAENNFAPYKEASYWPYVIRRYFFLFITIGLLISK